LNTREAVSTILAGGKLTKYRMAQDLGCAPILVNYWLKGTIMGTDYRELFYKIYGVEITE